MTAPETLQMPVIGEHGEPCQGCGAPLAADQRYCLECGQRRGGPRIDYRRYLAPEGGDSPRPPELPVASAPAPGPEKPERDFAPLAAVGGIAVLGLMLLVGVLIGKGNSTATSAPAPVIKVGEVTGGATADTESGGSKDAATESKGGKGSEKKGTGAKKVAGGLTGDAARNSSGTVQATAGDLNELNSKSGDSYEETVKKLPDKIATPGAPPPIDKSKAPGAGGGALTIK